MVMWWFAMVVFVIVAGFTTIWLSNYGQKRIRDIKADKRKKDKLIAKYFSEEK